MLHVTWNGLSHILPGQMLQRARLKRSRALKHLWDDYLEFEAYIKSNTAHEIYELDGEVTKTVM